MKKLGIALAAFALTLSLAACGSGGGSSAADPVKLGEAMLSEARDLPDMTVVHSGTADGEELFPYLSGMDYGKVSGYYMAYATAGSAEEIAVISLKDSSDAAEARASLEKHLQDRLGIFRVYGPDQAAMLENALISARDGSVALIICSNADEVEGVFRAQG